MAKTGVTFGHKAIDDKLKSLDPNTQKKLARQSLRKGAKLTADDTKQIIEDETDGEGAYAKSLVVRAMKRSRKRIGSSVHVDRKKYFQKYEDEYGHLPNPAAGESEPFYVPAALEFGYIKGNVHVPPLKAQRRGLYDNKEQVIQFVRSDMQEVLRQVAVK